MIALCALMAFADPAGAQLLVVPSQPPPAAAPASPAEGRWAVGIVNNGGAIRYQAGKKTVLEAKGLYSSNVLIAGPRLYHYLNNGSRLSLFCGVEGDYIKFTGKVSKGSGFAGGAFVGADLYFTRQLSLAVDFGPMYIGLKDGGSSQSVGGVDYVTNVGVYLHF